MHPGALIDSHGRTLRDLRVSVTDRCNFRCMYCLPETEAAANFYHSRFIKNGAQKIIRTWHEPSNILTFEEIERIVRVAVNLGIEKVRLTGGEPLLRQQLEKLVEKIAKIDGVKDLAMTTNGFFFAQKAKALRDAGLQRISFSMDSLDRENFKKITGRDSLQEVLDGIDMAQQLGFNPVKVNAVIIRGINDHEVEALAGFAQKKNISFRFIEFMPLDSGRAWQKELVVRGSEILDRLQKSFRLKQVVSTNKSETAKRWSFDQTISEGRVPRAPDSCAPDSAHAPAAEIGIIAPVSEPFCGHCNRLRLTADGKIRTCLFSVVEHDLRALVRENADDAAVGKFLQDAVWKKEARHHIGEPGFVQPERTMSCIGG